MMLQVTKQKEQEKNLIKFDEELHSYTQLDNNERYTSVTTFIKKFQKKKDWYGIATKYAIKHGGTPEEWLKTWENTKNKAGDKGTKFHEKKEELFRGLEASKEKYLGVHDVHASPEKIYGKYSLDLSELKPGVYSELMLYSHKYRLAGQADEVIIHPNKTFEINDYKTSKTIDKKSFYGKEGYEYMTAPVEKLQDCNWNHYSLQLSLYAKLLEEFGYKCKKLTIEHIVWPHHNIMRVNYMRKEIEAMLETI